MEHSILVAGASSPPNGEMTVTLAWEAAGMATRLAAVLALVACGLVSVAWWQEAPAVVATGLAVAVMIAAALVDAVDHRLPNVLVGTAAMPVAVAAAISLAAGSGDVSLGALAGAGLLAGPLLLAHLVSPVGMGFGDVKAGVVIGAAVGLVSPHLAVLTLVLALAWSAAWALLRRWRTVPLGPGLVVGSLLAMAIARWAGVSV